MNTSKFVKINDDVSHDREHDRMNTVFNNHPFVGGNVNTTPSNADAMNENAPNIQSSDKNNNGSMYPASVVKLLLITLLVVFIVALICIYLMKSSKDALNIVKKQMDLLQKSEMLLKNKVTSYDGQIKQMSSDLQYQRQQNQKLSNLIAKKNQYAEYPVDDDESVTNLDDTKEKHVHFSNKAEVKAMINKPRKTVSELQQENASEVERQQLEQDKAIQQEINENVSANSDDKKDEIFSAIINSGTLNE